MHRDIIPKRHWQVDAPTSGKKARGLVSPTLAPEFAILERDRDHLAVRGAGSNAPGQMENSKRILWALTSMQAALCFAALGKLLLHTSFLFLSIFSLMALVVFSRH